VIENDKREVVRLARLEMTDATGPYTRMLLTTVMDNERRHLSDNERARARKSRERLIHLRRANKWIRFLQESQHRMWKDADHARTERTEALKKVADLQWQLSGIPMCTGCWLCDLRRWWRQG
jgi:hypothetical protein